jgi:hypothetical protein
MLLTLRFKNDNERVTVRRPLTSAGHVDVTALSASGTGRRLLSCRGSAVQYGPDVLNPRLYRPCIAVVPK